MPRLFLYVGNKEAVIPAPPDNPEALTVEVTWDAVPRVDEVVIEPASGEELTVRKVLHDFKDGTITIHFESVPAEVIQRMFLAKWDWEDAAGQP